MGKFHAKLKKKKKKRDCLGFRDAFEGQSRFHMVQKALGGALAVRPL